MRSPYSPLIALAAIFTSGCAGSGLFGGMPFITSVSPCVGPVGTAFTITGLRFADGGTPTVKLNGLDCAVSAFDQTTITATVPAGASDGKIEVFNANGSGQTLDNFHVGPAGPVTEVEPNDRIDGIDATNTWDEIGQGTLSTVADKDHFRFRCLKDGKSYKVTLTPQIVGTVYLNGSARTFGPGGFFTFTAFGSTAILGITGGTGNYQLKVEEN